MASSYLPAASAVWLLSVGCPARLPRRSSDAYTRRWATSALYRRRWSGRRVPSCPLVSSL